ncbi:hypothetical protein LTR64_002523 [Lithohypha guttulata]|uniref:Uncharacterized protein n=1 Tax=Lithohypha guttulata TaxID=1690604 RepID=A0AAN7Y5G8_9EURO|nr:hypothetical protein LTR51_001251 [Lithohypha guttulata]KAK5083593.1 hypothetical protein LTR05_006096 [Lithohypha guttulata]
MDKGQDQPASASAEENLALIEGVLEFIQGNLNNIAKTWGTSSTQYIAARGIMEKYFDENLKKLKIDGEEEHLSLDDLLGKMSLDEKAS